MSKSIAQLIEEASRGPKAAADLRQGKGPARPRGQRAVAGGVRRAAGDESEPGAGGHAGAVRGRVRGGGGQARGVGKGKPRARPVAGAPAGPSPSQDGVAGGEQALPAVGASEQKRRLFCAALLKAGFNATEAYLTVDGAVTRPSAAELGSRLLREVETQAILAETVKAAWERNELDPAYIIGSWVAMSRANVMDYFEADDKGALTLKNLSKLDPVIQRNVAQLEVTTEKINEMVTAQKVKLKLVDRRQVFDSMAKAAELFGPLGGAEDSHKGIAAAIEQGFERVRKGLGGRTFDAVGIDITQAQEATG